jgi:glucose/arabinose dehydrogenase
MRRLLAAGLVVAAVASCSSAGEPAAPTTTASTVPPDPTTTTTVLAEGTLGDIELSTVEVATVEEPIAMAVRAGSPDLYVAEKAGRVRLIEVTERESSDDVTRQLQTTPLLDISDEVINDGERGLLGMAFSSDGRKLYLDFTREPDGATVVREYELGDRSTIDDDTARDLLVVEQPYANHNGGQLAVGPDGFLYVGLGDGGSRGDPRGNGQDTSTLLGSILRIDPDAGDPDGAAYGIPAGNPFADDDGSRPEVWLYGARNPWRFAFDAETGDLWVGDVGQNSYEEINRLPAVGGFDAGRGANLGWNEMEAAHSFEGGENPDGAVLPLHEYGRDEGCTVLGGYVYRGEAIPALDGAYLYADLCAPGISGLQLDGDTLIDARTWDLPVARVYAFGQDDAGEVYVLTEDGRVQLLTAA